MKARKKKKLLKEAWLNFARRLPACLPTEKEQKAWAVKYCNIRIDEHRRKSRKVSKRTNDALSQEVMKCRVRLMPMRSNIPYTR